MLRIKQKILRFWRWTTKSKKHMVTMVTMLGVVIAVGLLASASGGPGNGTNQLSARKANRLDLHWGGSTYWVDHSVQAYSDATLSHPLTGTALNGLYWANPEFSVNGFTGWITYPLGTLTSGKVADPADDQKDYIRHYFKGEALDYIVGDAGNFQNQWDTNTWYRSLPGMPSYSPAGKHPSTGYVYMSNNYGFNVYGPDADGYYQLWTANNDEVMQRNTPPNYYPAFDKTNSDTVNAGYTWDIIYTTGWGTNDLHQGANTISMAGMDLAGNYLTEDRTLKWDTVGPHLSDTIDSKTHNGWINKALVDNGNTYTISGRDSTAYTTDISGVHASSLQFSYDGGGYGGYNYSSDPGGVTGTTTYTGSYASLVNQLGQGSHSVGFTMFDWAGNYGVSGEPVKIDTVAPTITARPNYGQFNSTKTGIAVDLSFSDATSGVDASTEAYQWVQEGGSPTDNGWWRAYAGQPVTQTQKGVWNLYYKGSDNAGNASSGHSGPYYCGSLSGYIQNPNAIYFNGQDVIASVYVHSDTSGDITPANSASVTLVAKNANGTVLTSQTKDLVVPNNETQLVWYKFHIPDDSVGPVALTATINSSLADAQHNPFYLNVDSGPAVAANFLDMKDDLLPNWVTPTMSPPVSTDTSASWQEWSYAGGTFTHNTYTASATESLKIQSDPDSPPPVKVDPVTGHVTMPSGYPIVLKPSVTVQTNESLDAITGAQNAFARYPEWNYGYDHANMMKTTSSGSNAATKSYTASFNLPENGWITNGGFDAVLDRITNRLFHLTPGKFYQYSDTYTPLVTATDIWTPAGKIEASATDSVTLDGFIDNDWSPEQTNKQMLGQ